MTCLEDMLGFQPRSVLVFALGGGGDIVSAALNAYWLEKHRVRTVLAAIPWERFPIDPCPGPVEAESFNEVVERVGNAVALENLCTAFRRRCGTHFIPQVCRVADLLRRRVYAVDAWQGVEGIRETLAELAELHGVDAILGVDVGGDVLAEGLENGLWSPLADSVGFAACIETGLPIILAVHSPGADGELSISEILERIADIAALKGLLGARMVSERELELLQYMLEGGVVTEASVVQLLARRGLRGVLGIRGGTRKVLVTPLQAMVFYLDGHVVYNISPLAKLVAGTRSLEEARSRLNEAGVFTELDLEELLCREFARGKNPDVLRVRETGRREVLRRLLDLNETVSGERVSHAESKYSPVLQTRREPPALPHQAV